MEHTCNILLAVSQFAADLAAWHLLHAARHLRATKAAECMSVWQAPTAPAAAPAGSGGDSGAHLPAG